MLLSLVPKAFLFFAFFYASSVDFVDARPQFSLNKGAVLAGATNITQLTTNAARLTRGLKPLPPRQLYDPTRIRAARDTTVSSVPFSGYIALRTPNTNILRGWVSKDISTSYSNRIRRNQGVVDPSQLLRGVVYVPAGSTSYGPSNLAIADSPYQFPYFGIVCGSIATSPPPFSCLMSPTNATPEGSVPQAVGNLPYSVSGNNAQSESMIWYLDTATKRLTAKFVQPTGTLVDVFFGWNDGQDRFVAYGYGTVPALTAEIINLYLESAVGSL